MLLTCACHIKCYIINPILIWEKCANMSMSGWMSGCNQVEEGQYDAR